MSDKRKYFHWSKSDLLDGCCKLHDERDTLKAELEELRELNHKAALDRIELKARVEELGLELRLDRVRRVNQSIIDLIDFADARPDLWEYLLHTNTDKVEALIGFLKGASDE